MNSREAATVRTAFETLKDKMEGVATKAECLLLLASLMKEMDGVGIEENAQEAGEEVVASGEVPEGEGRVSDSEEERIRHEEETLEASVYELFLGGADIYVHSEDEKFANGREEEESVEQVVQEGPGDHLTRVESSRILVEASA